MSDGLGKEMPVMYLVEQKLHLQEWLLFAEFLVFFFVYRPGYGVPVGLVFVLYVRMLVSVCCSVVLRDFIIVRFLWLWYASQESSWL